MTTYFSEDAIPLKVLKVNPDKVLKQTTQALHLLAPEIRGLCVEVIQDLDSHQMTQQQREFNNAIAQGLVDISKGRTVTIDEVRKSLGLAE